MKLIDAEAVKAEINSIGNIADFIKEAICAEIDEQPEAVVRCKDCKYSTKWYECKWVQDETPHEDDYCSYGERKEDD